MRQYQGRLLLSAGDLVTFLGCAHAAALTRRSLSDPLEKAAPDEAMNLRQERGLAHEAAYREQLQKRHGGMVAIPDHISLAERAAQTQIAMRAGAPVIYQGVLLDAAWHGYADFLVRVEEPSALGAWSYQAEDTKLARTAKAKHAIQLAVYTDLLERAQGHLPRRMAVVLGGGDTEIIRTADIMGYYRHARDRAEAFMVGRTVPETTPEPCSHCSLCDWRERCEAEWEAADHLSLVANIRTSHIHRLTEAGINTVAALAGLPNSEKVPGLPAESLEKLRAQAALQIEGRKGGRPLHELLQADPGRGFERLPRPTPHDLYFDMEGDPHFPDGLEYLFGFVGADTASPFTSFWAHDHDEERRALEQVMDFITGHLTKHPDAYIYHYNHYEPSALKRLAARYGTREAALDDLLRRWKFVDLFKVVREGVRVSESRYSLKNLERFYMAPRSGDVANAADSIVVYEQFRKTGDQALLQQIAHYNEVDCRSTGGLHQWLLTQRAKGIQWFNGQEIVETAEEKERRERREAAEVEYLQLEAALLNGAPASEADFRRLVAQLAGFHRREQKPQWWAMFDRMDRDDDDLIEDADCLGALRLVGKPEPDKQSLIYTYRFPGQETKLREGGMCTIAATGENAGTITTLDMELKRATLRLSKRSGILPEQLSLGPTGPLKPQPKDEAVRRFAQSILAGDGQFAAIERLLKREPPRIRCHRVGTPLLPAGLNPVEAAVAAAAGLDHSYLFIQGPPGTGKTYTASHVIVDQIRRGKTVGVSSNSHKAINNLLKTVEAQARAAGVAFSGLKKSSAQDEDTHFDGQMIQDAFDNKAFPAQVDLIAGTAWLFARPEMEQQLDILFVDEAGQVSLADIVAMGTAAKNIVLIGDQMQLGQPIQGVHPGESGLSVLDYLLQGAATVPLDRGIFLDVSRRMHPDICCFISDTIYDGQLTALAENAERILRPRRGATLPVPESGVFLVPVEHADRTQSCPEEAEAVARCWQDLLELNVREIGGRCRRMKPDDILIVAPYNLQVERIRKLLPDTARVGTVDKFQGQEAMVVLVSMTASSGEAIPRGLDFLLNRNRLNVAISRSRALSLVFASPRLLEIDCDTIEDLRLANTLCCLRMP